MIAEMVRDEETPAVENENNIVRINIEYNTSTGKFKFSGNCLDEVLTTGMLELTKIKMKENYQIQRIVELKKESEQGIIGVQ